MNNSSPDDTDNTPEEEEISSDPVEKIPPVPESSHLVRSGEHPLDFSFTAYDEDIFICGSKGSGKSYLANQLMKSLNGVSVWVYDFNSQMSSSRAMVFNSLDDLLKVYDEAKRGHYILQPFDNSENTFRRFCHEAFKRGNLVLIMDEIHTWLSKQSQNKEFNTIILSGRPRGISCVSISSRPASCPNHVLSNAKHVFSFKLNLESDLKFLESYLGHDVWILMPPDKRARLKDEPQLEEHSFYYRDMDKDTGVIGKV